MVTEGGELYVVGFDRSRERAHRMVAKLQPDGSSYVLFADIWCPRRRRWIRDLHPAARKGTLV